MVAIIYEHFTKDPTPLVPAGGVKKGSKATCNHCKVVLIMSQGSTSTLRGHLK